MALVSSYDPLISSRATAMRAKARKGPEPAAAFQELVRASLELEGPGGGYLTILWEVVDSLSLILCLWCCLVRVSLCRLRQPQLREPCRVLPLPAAEANSDSGLGRRGQPGQ